MNLRTIKRWIRPLLNTPFHPQWLTRERPGLHHALQALPDGIRVLDIGCADKWVQRELGPRVRYVGLDYPATATDWYATVPDVFGDAHALPFPEASLDVVCLFDVLEHLEEPGRVMTEIARVLEPGGKVLVQVPFLYPLHDAPRDFRRYTQFGLAVLAREAGLQLRESTAQGSMLETVALMFNLALSTRFVDWLSGGPLSVVRCAVVAPLLPPLILFANLVGAMDRQSRPADGLMPFSWFAVFEKPPASEDPT